MAESYWGLEVLKYVIEYTSCTNRELTMFELALYGGAFNPPHAGHAQVMIDASRFARRVLVAPSFRHPYGKQMVDYELRMRWIASITAKIQSQCDAEVRACRIEQVAARGNEDPIYSYTLLSLLADSLALDDKQIALVVGRDVERQLPDFHRGSELLERFSILCVEEKIPVRSTLLRERLVLGEHLPSHWMAPGMTPVNYKHYASPGN